jgi:hypothetical protein
VFHSPGKISLNKQTGLLGFSGFNARMLVSQVDSIIDVMAWLHSGKSENRGSIFDEGQKFLTLLVYSG